MHHAVHSPVASIIIWRTKHVNLLDYTLNTICQQSIGKHTFEVVIVNHGSPAEVADVVDKYTYALPIRYLSRSKRSKRAEPALETGVRNARGQLCIFVDPGVLLSSTCVEEHVLRYQQESRATAGIGYSFCYAQPEPGNRELSRFTNVLDVKKVDQSIWRLRSLAVEDGREVYYREWNDQLQNVAPPALLFEASNTAIDAKVLRRIFLTPGVEDYGSVAARLWADKIPIVLNRKAEAIAYARH